MRSTIARTVPGCTVAFEPATRAITAETDGFLRVDAATYRGAAGTTWNATITVTCPPSPPETLQTLVGSGWLTAPAPRPLAAPDRITGREVQGAIERAWTFTRTP